MRNLWSALLALTLWASVAQAQEDSVFAEYDAYAQFVDTHIMTRDFADLILRLGGRDEYTPDELKTSVLQLRGVWPRDFANSTVFRREDLGGGVSQEARLYWTGKQYAYFYALLHDRADDFVVLSFYINSSSAPILDRF